MIKHVHEMSRGCPGSSPAMLVSNLPAFMCWDVIATFGGAATEFFATAVEAVAVKDVTTDVTMDVTTEFHQIGSSASIEDVTTDVTSEFRRGGSSAAIEDVDMVSAGIN